MVKRCSRASRVDTQRDASLEFQRLMKEIDEVIEQHGGWPGAFQTGTGGASADSEDPMLDGAGG